MPSIAWHVHGKTCHRRQGEQGARWQPVSSDPHRSIRQHVRKGQTMQDIRHDLRQFIIDNFLFGQVSTDKPFSDEESLLERGIVDSTGILELVGFLEERYSMTIAN